MHHSCMVWASSDISSRDMFLKTFSVPCRLSPFFKKLEEIVIQIYFLLMRRKMLFWRFLKPQNLQKVCSCRHIDTWSS